MKLGNVTFCVLATLVGFAILDSLAYAQSEALTNEPTSITVQNNFNLTQVTPLNFGSWVIVVSPTNTDGASLSFSPFTETITPTNSDPNIFFIQFGGSPTIGEYSISNAAPFTVMNVSAGDLQNLVCGTCLGSPRPLLLDSISFDNSTPTTLANGSINFKVGANISTGDTAQPFDDGAYSGSFDLTVSY